MTSQYDIAKTLLEIQAVIFQPNEPITFKSGIFSPIYVDNRRVPFWPAAWDMIIDGFQKIIVSDIEDVDVIAGIEAAGIPHSAALGYALKKPSVFVRKEAKAHGTKSRVEGGDVAGKRVILIEDTITTGSSSLAGVKALCEAGAVVKDCIAIYSYGLGECMTAFQSAEVTLHTLTTLDDLLSAAIDSGQLDTEGHETIKMWRISPHTWGKDSV